MSLTIILSAWEIRSLDKKFGVGGLEKFCAQKNFLPKIRVKSTAVIWFVLGFEIQMKSIFFDLKIFLKVWEKEERGEIFKTLGFRVSILFDFFTYATSTRILIPKLALLQEAKRS